MYKIDKIVEFYGIKKNGLCKMLNLRGTSVETSTRLEMKRFILFIFCLLSLMASFVHSQDYVFSSDLTSPTPTYGNRLSIDPLVGYAELKQNSCKQGGWLGGVKTSWQYLCIGSAYLSAQASYKLGNLTGLNCNDIQLLEGELKSRYSDFWVDGQIGWTFGVQNAYVAPFLVVGYERESNDYLSPSLLELKNKLTYGYFGAGIVSEAYLTPVIKAGLNAKFRWMFNATHQTGGEPEIKDKGIACANCFHYTIELPLIYQNCNWEIGIVPFYEYKKYDKHKFDLAGKEMAELQLIGSLIQLSYLF